MCVNSRTDRNRTKAIVGKIVMSILHYVKKSSRYIRNVATCLYLRERSNPHQPLEPFGKISHVVCTLLVGVGKVPPSARLI
jgi:hypothetical protein